jgi:hypothetical protein
MDDVDDEIEEDERRLELDGILGGECDKSFCRQPGVAHSDDGDFLCEDHLGEWMERLVMSPFEEIER